MPTADYTVKIRDIPSPLRLALTDSSGPIDLTTVSAIVFRMVSQRTGIVKITNGTGAIYGDPTKGIVEYVWQTNDLNALGFYNLEAILYWVDGRTETYPSNRFVVIQVVAGV